MLGLPLNSHDWENVENATTRLSLAVWCHKHGDDGDHGPEGVNA